MTGQLPDYDIGYLTDPGVRDTNEDACIFYSTSDELFMAVADGVSGPKFGDHASSYAVNRVKELFFSFQEREADLSVALIRTIQQACSELYHKAHELQLSGLMGTTIITAVLREDVLTLGWVGHSQAYAISTRLQQARQISKDHTEAYELVKARVISRQDYQQHPRRNVLTRALGIDHNVEVDTRNGRLEPDDYVLLCSDGLTRYITEKDMVEILLNREQTAQQKTKNLLTRAKQRGGEDNITVMVLHYIQPARFQNDGPVTQPEAYEFTDASQQRRIIAFGAIIVLVIIIGILGVFLMQNLTRPLAGN